MSNTTDFDRDELAAALRMLARKTQGLARVAPDRVDTPKRMRQCLGDVLTLLESATELLYRPNARVPKLTDERLPTTAERAVSGDLQGTTRALSISEMIDLLGTCEKSGVLKVVNAAETFSIKFQRGSVVHASSDHAPTGQRLGDILVEQGYIEAERFAEFLAQNAGSGVRIGVALERDKVVSREQLADALERQIQYLFHRLFATTEATFTFHEQATASKENRVRMSVMQLLLESARAHDEALR